MVLKKPYSSAHLIGYTKKTQIGESDDDVQDIE